MALVTVFTIPKPFTDPHITLIQRNAISSWKSLGKEVEVLLLGDDAGVAEAAEEFAVVHIGDAAKNEFGTPLLDWAFKTAAQRGSGDLTCYTNADIILLEDFLPALQRLPRDRPYLGIGRRWNCDVSGEMDFGNPEALRRWVASSGNLDEGRGSDLFISPRGTDFAMPAFAVGRPGWDNWLIGKALRLGIPVIDLTPSVTAVHQNHDYSHVSQRTGSDWEGPEADRNRALGGWIDRYTHTPANATHLLERDGLRRARSPRHLLARVDEFLVLNPIAAPVRGAVRGARRVRERLAAGS